MDVSVEDTSPDGLPGGPHVRNSLSQLEKVRLDVVGSKHQTYRGACTWFAQAPKLHDLVIKGRGSETNYFKGWTPLAKPYLMKLHSITMQDIHLTNIPKKILEHVDLPSLRLLMLRDCSNITAFLLSLAQRFKETNKSALHTFVLGAVSVPEDVQEASAELIKSVNGLKHIEIRAMTGTVMDLRCLEANGTSLRDVRLWSSDEESPKYYSAQELGQMRLICPLLEQLSVTLGDLSLTTDDIGLNEAFRLANNTDCVQKLKALAQHDSLRLIEFTDPPLLLTDYTANERRLLYIEVANQIFQHLIEIGSEVQRLRFMSTHDYVNVDADEDGHIWPRYAFDRGTVSVNRGGRQELVKTIAVPNPQNVPEKRRGAE